MIGTNFLLIKSISNFFRAKLLLTDKKFAIGLDLKALLGQEIETTESS